MTTLDELRSRLEACGQSHVLAFWNELDRRGRAQLQTQLERVDWEQLARLGRGEDRATPWAELAARAQPPRAYRADGSGGPVLREHARSSGEQALRKGEVGFILVAGGQGTRLGFSQPKGMFPLGPISQRSLFQILCDRLRAVAGRYGIRIPLYLMTSPATHNDTVASFQNHVHCGLDPQDVHIFCQGVMPAVDAATGRVLLEAKDALCLSPDGHGGMLAALSRSGCLDHAKECGIRHLFYAQIDNPLAQICDPTLIGYHLLSHSELTTQVVAKVDALERVGNVVTLDGQLQIIEYSDLPEEVARRTHPDGSLYLWAGNIAVHVFDRGYLEQMAAHATGLPFHRALKRTPCLNDRGELVEPDQPNSLKFERFIFDLIPLAKNAIAVEGLREEIFAPVKNATGAASDTPELAQAAMLAQHRRWLTAAGASVGSDVPVEINPLWALDVEEIRSKVAPGTQITEPTYFV